MNAEGQQIFQSVHWVWLFRCWFTSSEQRQYSRPVCTHSAILMGLGGCV